MFAHIQLPQAANDTHTNSVHEVNIPDMRLQTEKGDKKNLALFNTEFNTDNCSLAVFAILYRGVSQKMTLCQLL